MRWDQGGNVSVDLHRLGPTDQTGFDSRPDRGRPARGRLVGPRRAAHIKRRGGGSVAQCPKFVALYPPTETLADQGCAEAAGSSTSSPLSPGGHGTARRHPCASRCWPRRRHCYISPCAATSSPFHGGAMAGGNGGHRKVFIYVKKSNLPARSTPRCSKEY